MFRATICTMMMCAAAVPQVVFARNHVARPVTFPAEPVDATGLILADALSDTPADDDMVADWRLPHPKWRDPNADDALRWRVKVRPNRAMGRMSLSF